MGDAPDGCGQVPRTVPEDIRTILVDFITNVLREETSNELRATGVITQLLDGSSKTVDATKKIVVSGAVYCSSAIMMRGSREELVQFNINGKIDLPGAGRSLTDYLVSSTLEY
ncbi:hypothetical protein BO85DRAFT_484172 [Aspergillus piperis CBS 112811]|uniref:Glucose-methanol-choline oxidoreductase N-terminal domain-containing protein n=1 Tax=Aspergillus piperis CBS 112811 TaxID=1448313 RepID=A0A8G1RBS7_9EURO|nr:hypothetical protein BO85DRAFT_484172 [Aspergillus piperis CBS 112811]RAH62157.1 hypothetical protein BO85DRAFT_484172 [Aspergillus piperis CBS 112811]